MSFLYSKAFISLVYRVLAKCNNKPTVTSSNTNVVSVTYAGSDSRGYLFDLTAKSQGLVTITATLNGKSVTMRASLGCSLDTSSYTFKVGAKYTFWLSVLINQPLALVQLVLYRLFLKVKIPVDIYLLCKHKKQEKLTLLLLLVLLKIVFLSLLQHN